MTDIETAEAELPNGFHDATLLDLSLNYERGEAVMIINADVSDSDASDSGEPEWRRGELHIKGIAFISIDEPGAISQPKALWITSGAGQPSTSPIELPTLPDDCFLHWFFVNEWNGFIRIAAKEAEWRWMDS